MTRGVISCLRDDTLLDAAVAMTVNRVHAVAVHDPGEEQHFSVLSDGDLLEAVGLGAASADDALANLAATEPLTIAAAATAREAAELMREHEVNHLFVVDPIDGRPVGVLSSLDVARLLIGAIGQSVDGPARVLVGHDGAAGGDDAVVLARLLAGEGGEVHALLAVPVPPRQTGDPPVAATPDEHDWLAYCNALIESGRNVLEHRALERLPGIEAYGDVVIDNSPAAALAGVTESERPDFVAVGSSSHGRLGRVLAGSTAERLAQGSPSPVAIAPRGYAAIAPSGVERIAVACAEGRESERAFALAAGLARRFDAELQLITVAEPSIRQAALLEDERDVLGGRGLGASPEARARVVADALAAGHADDLKLQVEVARGPAVATILETCRRSQPDLLVVGSRRYGPLARVLLGGTAMRLIREASCPVVVAPRAPV